MERTIIIVVMAISAIAVLILCVVAWRLVTDEDFNRRSARFLSGNKGRGLVVGVAALLVVLWGLMFLARRSI